MAELRALTVRPPWSHFIAHCQKGVENRTWGTRYRGLLAIHAGTRWDSAAERDPVALAAWRDWTASLPPMNTCGPLRKDSIHIDYGAVVAVVAMGPCHHESTEEPRNSCSEWAMPGLFHWSFVRLWLLPEPVPCKGKLGLWRLPEDVEKAVREQLEASDDESQ